MNILFLTLCRITDVNERGIYTDLMRKMRDEGHKVFIVTPSERRYKCKTGLKDQNDMKILNVRTLNIQKTNVIEKGIGTIILENQFHKAILKYLSNVKVDIVIYSTPPITLTKVIASVKKRTGAASYLLLKDIFPQNAVDLGMMSKHGFLYKYFRLKEKKLYNISDYIGCMSPANVRYVLSHNPKLSPLKVEVCPNSIELSEKISVVDRRKELRAEYKIPSDSTVFIYGGNLGKPQGVEFLIEVINSNQNNKGCYFVVIGSGTEYYKVKRWFDENHPGNAMLIPGLPKEEYDLLVQACDVGLIFLDRRFTIPNYPSRLLTYLEFRKPVLAATDVNTDLGRIAEYNHYGFWSESGDIRSFNRNLARFVEDPSIIKSMGEAGYDYLLKNYTVDNSCSQILKHFSDL